MNMSSQSSVYTEKKIAAYESLFKESNFAKPQEVYLTITVAHVFGQAYILEQEGTKEGDPVYSRFVCPLEEITKVYVNDKIKKPWPLFIQCDTNVKGVIHRKRIVIPCLNDPTAIADQINEVKALHMQKYEAAIERENQRKRAELETARMQEQIANDAKSKLPPLPAVEKLPEPITEAPVSPAPEPKKKAAAETSKGIKSAKALTNELEDSFKALESIDSAKSDIKPLPKKPIFDFDEFDKVFSSAPKAESKAEEAPKPAAEAPAPKPKAEASTKPKIIDLNNIDEAIEAMPKQTKKKAEKPVEPVVEAAPEPVVEAAPEPVVEAAPEPVIEAAPESVIEAAPEPVIEAAPEPAPAPTPKPVRVNPIGKTAELSEFESAVIILKEKKDSGEITEEQYVSEKKRLIATLY
ncbi:MAG: hypothetical protein MSJ26_03170 [Oscillospiraceae bacterium]|nr:hypothetical protein [Oscillospiraceae bacterium]